MLVDIAVVVHPDVARILRVDDCRLELVRPRVTLGYQHEPVVSDVPHVARVLVARLEQSHSKRVHCVDGIWFSAVNFERPSRRAVAAAQSARRARFAGLLALG